LKHADRVAAIELDPALAEHIRERFSGVELVESSALEVDWSPWGAGVLTGNLPYYIATPIISRYLRAPGLLSPAVFLIQKEVAERITARPGGREYGYFSVECQFLAKTEYLFTVAPGAFRPPPKVDSAAIRLTPRYEFLVSDIERFLSFVSTCFRQKRKTLRNNLGTQFDAGVYASRRAEQLSIEEFVELYRAL
jgi:16S rRNA (adenine1518-N6/adenine1519-N6)-dimethyltransferase